MSNEELKRTIEALRAFTKEHTATPEKALAALVKMGIATPDGQLSEHYKRSA